MSALSKLVRSPFLFIIRIYQKIFSPDHSFWAKHVYPQGYCKFYPSCSEYSRQVIKKRGVFVGMFKSGWRVMRCNPRSDGGVDQP